MIHKKSVAHPRDLFLGGLIRNNTLSLNNLCYDEYDDEVFSETTNSKFHTYIYIYTYLNNKKVISNSNHHHNNIRGGF